MALNNCIDCPQTCFGNVTPSDCVEYGGVSLKGYLDSIPTGIVESAPSQALTTDDITSNSLIRNKSGVCSSKIVIRSFNYSLTTSQTGSILGWDLTDIIRGLPKGYTAPIIRVKVVGAAVNGKNIITDSDKYSGGINIKTNQYPATADILVRVSSPCGDIDMVRKLTLTSPANVGTFYSTMNTSDLNQASGSIGLTEQLDNIEALLVDLGVAVDSTSDFGTKADLQAAQIDAMNDSLSDPSSLVVNYSDGGTNFSKNLGTIISNIYTELNNLKTEVSSQAVQISSMQSQIDSINA